MTLGVRHAAQNCFHPMYHGLCLLTISWGVTPAPVTLPHPPCVLFSPVPPPMPFLPALCHSCAAVLVAPTALVRALARQHCDTANIQNPGSCNAALVALVGTTASGCSFSALQTVWLGEAGIGETCEWKL